MESGLRQALATGGLISVAAVWGLTFVLVRWTVATVDPYQFLFLRFVVASIALALLFWRHLQRIDRSVLRSGTVLGIWLTACFIAQTEGLRFTTATNSALITCLYMVLIPIGVYAMTRKPLPWTSLAGIALAIPGSILLTSGSPSGVNRGDLITAIVPIAGAMHILLTGEYAKRHALVPLVLIQFICITAISGAVALFRGSLLDPLPPIGWFTVAFNAIFASCLGFTVQTAAQRVIDPTRAGIIFALEAVFGTLFGWWLGGEAFTTASFIGACLMAGGMIASEVRPLTRSLIDKVVT